MIKLSRYITTYSKDKNHREDAKTQLTGNIVHLDPNVNVMKNRCYFLLISLMIPSFLLLSCKKKNDVTTAPPPPADTLTVNLGPDKTILEGDSVILDPGHQGSTYLWSTGATTQIGRASCRERV